MVRSEELYDAILNGDAKKAHAATQAALAADTAPMDLIAGNMVPRWTKSVDCSKRRNISCRSYFWPVAP